MHESVITAPDLILFSSLSSSYSPPFWRGEDRIPEKSRSQWVVKQTKEVPDFQRTLDEVTKGEPQPRISQAGPPSFPAYRQEVQMLWDLVGVGGRRGKKPSFKSVTLRFEDGAREQSSLSFNSVSGSPYGSFVTRGSGGVRRFSLKIFSWGTD